MLCTTVIIKLMKMSPSLFMPSCPGHERQLTEVWNTWIFTLSLAFCKLNPGQSFPVVTVHVFENFTGLTPPGLEYWVWKTKKKHWPRWLLVYSTGKSKSVGKNVHNSGLMQVPPVISLSEWRIGCLQQHVWDWEIDTHLVLETTVWKPACCNRLINTKQKLNACC